MLKDMACRTMLLKLERLGYLRLPTARSVCVGNSVRHRTPVAHSTERFAMSFFRSMDSAEEEPEMRPLQHGIQESGGGTLLQAPATEKQTDGSRYPQQLLADLFFSEVIHLWIAPLPSGAR
jgi:hypothetical protein